MNNDGSTILVTGATGTLGGEVVRQLSTKGHINIRAAARSANNPTLKYLKSVEIVELDYNRPESLTTSFKDVMIFSVEPRNQERLIKILEKATEDVMCIHSDVPDVEP